MSKKFLLVSVLSATLSGCEYIHQLNDPGEIDSLYVSIGAIQSIEIAAPCSLVLTNRSSDEILKARGCDYILNDYNFNNENGKLVIGHKNGDLIQKEKMATIWVQAGSTPYITANSACVITNDADTLFLDKLAIVVNGRGMYTETDLTVRCLQLNLATYGRSNQASHQLKGTTSSLQTHLEGCALLDASNMTARDVWVYHQSVADCFFRADSSLTVTFASSGNIYYKGKPSVTTSRQTIPFMSASGRLYPLSD
ncbi:MAG: DUF2807 domain-containing protein [Breznakibacter sp.]